MIPERNPYNNWKGNGSTTTFDFDFYIEDEKQLAVYHTNSQGVQTLLTYGTDYSIEEFKNADGSKIEFPLEKSNYDILGEDEIISLCLTLPISQENEYGKSSLLDLKAIEYSLDYLTRICQIINRQMERSVKTQEGSSQSADELIEALQQAQVNATNSANEAAASANAANNSAIEAGNEATIATQQAADVQQTYNTAMNDIATSRQSSLDDIETALAGAERDIEVNRENALSDISTGRANIANDLSNATNLMTQTQNTVVNNIQALGVFMEGDRLFYYDNAGVKHEFRNDFGGIAPMPVKHKEVQKTDEGFLLTWSDPDDSVYQSNVYCTWGSTLILRKEGVYPESPFDGEVVINNTIRNQYAIEGYLDEVDTTKDYKYRAFPCSINRVYSLDNFNKFGLWVYSLTRLNLETIPEEKIVYRGVNAHYNKAYNDFAAGNKVKLGDWENAPFLLKDRLAPCAVSFDGELRYFLDVNDYTKKEDGTPSNNSDTSTDLNFYMRVKLLYRRKRKNANGDTEIDISNEKINDEYKPYGGFVKPDGTLREYIYLPIYKGSLINGKCRSIAGQTPMNGQTAPNERNYCKANGAGHDMITHADREIFEDLYMLVFKNMNSQAALGQGKSNGGDNINACLKSGTMDKMGLFAGSTSTAEGIKLFGQENFYGSQWWRVLGEVLVNGVRKVKLCQGTSDGSTVEDFNFTGEGFITLSELPTISGRSGGYISKEQTVDDIGTFPIVLSGSSSTNESDGMWYNNSGTMVAVRGGYSGAGAICGVFCSHLASPASDATWYFGSSVSYKPL